MPNSIKLHETTFELCKPLSASQCNLIDSWLGTYKKLMFTVFRDVDIGKATPSGWTGDATIALVSNAKGKWLGIRRKSGEIRWD